MYYTIRCTICTIRYSTVIHIFHVISVASNGSIRYHFCGPDAVCNSVLFPWANPDFRKSVLQNRDVYPGSRIRIIIIPDTNIYHPGSEFFPSRIRSFSILDPGSASKNLGILTKKKISKLSENMIRVIYPGSGFWFFIHFASRIQKSTDSRTPDLVPQHCRKFD